MISLLPAAGRAINSTTSKVFFDMGFFEDLAGLWIDLDFITSPLLRSADIIGGRKLCGRLAHQRGVRLGGGDASNRFWWITA